MRYRVQVQIEVGAESAKEAVEYFLKACPGLHNLVDKNNKLGVLNVGLGKEEYVEIID